MKLITALLLAVVSSIPAQPLFACAYPKPITCGDSVLDRMENSTCMFSDNGNPYFEYGLTAVSGQVLDVYMYADFSMYLGVYSNASSAPLVYTRSTSGVAHVEYDVPSGGQYFIVAASESTRSGLFRVDLDCAVVCLHPSITQEPMPTMIQQGQSATLSVQANGTPPLSFAWRQLNGDGSILSTNQFFTTAPLFMTAGYFATVTNSCGTTTSGVGYVTVEACQPVGITIQPESTTMPVGGAASLSVGASGGTPYTFEWYRGSPPDTSDLVASGISPTIEVRESGTYWVRVKNACSSVDSVPAVVGARVPPRQRAVRHVP